MKEEELNKYVDYVVEKMLFNISRRELEKCNEKQTVPSKEVLDTINTLVNFHKIMIF